MAATWKNDYLNRIQIKMILEAFGMPLKEQPGTAASCQSYLDAFKKSQPEKYQLFLAVFRDKNMDILKTDPPIHVPYEDIVTLLDDDIFSNATKGIGEVDAKLSECKRLNSEIGINLQKTLQTYYRKIEEQAKSTDKNIVEYTAKAIETLRETFVEAVEKESKNYRKIEVKVNGYKAKKIEGIMHDKYEDVLSLCANRVNTLLVGPAGCGKTVLAHQIAQALSLDYASQSCSEGISESNFVGWLLPLGDNGRFEYVQSEFIKIYENGGVFLFDEMDASDPNVLVFLNQALANDSFHLPQRLEKPKVTKHKDFVAIGAANTFGTGADLVYHGRNALDAATLDRFKVGTVEMDYCKTLEEKIINEEVLEWGRMLRQKIQTNRMEKILSTRVMKDCTTMIGAGWDILKVANQYFSDWSEEELKIIGWNPQEVIDYSGSTTIPKR